MVKKIQIGHFDEHSEQDVVAREIDTVADALQQVFAFAAYSFGSIAHADARVRELAGTCELEGGLFAAMVRALINDPQSHRDAHDALEACVLVTTDDELAMDDERLQSLLWRVKRSCLGSLVTTLRWGLRVPFVLVDVLGVTVEEATAITGLRETALRVRLARARKAIDVLVDPLCSLREPKNPCSCRARVGNVVAGREPLMLDTGCAGRPFRRRIVATSRELFSDVPAPQIPAETLDAVLEILSQRGYSA